MLTAPILWAAVTDAAAFAALLASEVGPVRDYGVMMAIGALLVPVCIGLLVPGLAQLGSWDALPQRAWGEDMLDRALSWSTKFIHRAPVAVALASLVLGAVLATGMVRLKVETDFTRNFRHDSPLAQSYEFVEQRLTVRCISWPTFAVVKGGAIPWNKPLIMHSKQWGVPSYFQHWLWLLVFYR